MKIHFIERITTLGRSLFTSILIHMYHLNLIASIAYGKYTQPQILAFLHSPALSFLLILETNLC
jgi:hypothetical protein